MDAINEKQRVRVMNSLFKKLKAEEQQRLIAALEENILLTEAARIDASINKSSTLPILSMQDIVKECRISRAEVYERRKAHS